MATFAWASSESHQVACHGHLASWHERWCWFSPLLCWLCTSGCLKHVRLVSYVWLGWIPNFEDFLQVKERYSDGAEEVRLNSEGGILRMRDDSGKDFALDTLWNTFFYWLPSAPYLEGIIVYLFATLCSTVSPLTSVLLFPSCFPFIFVLRGWGLLAIDCPSPVCVYSGLL